MRRLDIGTPRRHILGFDAKDRTPKKLERLFGRLRHADCFPGSPRGIANASMPAPSAMPTTPAA